MIVYGSYGHLVVDEATGNVLEYVREDGATNEYADIVRFDLAEYAEYNGGLDDTDIVLIGFWTDAGKYCQPDYDDRKGRGPEITKRFRDAQAACV